MRCNGAILVLFVLFSAVRGWNPSFDPRFLDGTNGFVVEGIQRTDQTGISVSGAGDLNGDGFADIIIGADEANGFQDSESNAGTCYVVYGKEVFDRVLPLEAYLTSQDNGVEIHGVDPGDQAGVSVSGGADVNGDGVPDLLIGANERNNLRGGAFIVYGKKSPARFNRVFNLDTLDGANGFSLPGVTDLDEAGYSVSFAGDVNADGFHDIIIGAPKAEQAGAAESHGEAYVVFGKNASKSAFPTTLNLASLNGENGFTIIGIAEGDNAGLSVSGAGDLNHDGIDDLVIGANRADPNGQSFSGEVYVVFGAKNFGSTLSLSSLSGSNGFTLQGVGAGDQTGISVSGAGDVNGDGVDDLVVGASKASSANAKGKAYVIFGRNASHASFSRFLLLSDLDGSNGFSIEGVDEGDEFGFAVSRAGDVNDDGVSDLIIGAKDGKQGSVSRVGEAYVIMGSKTFAAEFNLTSLDGANGFVIFGLGGNDNAGYSVAGVGDVNGDGVDDMAIGAWHASPGGLVYAGEVYVVFGEKQEGVLTAKVTTTTTAVATTTTTAKVTTTPTPTSEVNVETNSTTTTPSPVSSTTTTTTTTTTSSTTPQATTSSSSIVTSSTTMDLNITTTANMTTTVVDTTPAPPPLLPEIPTVNIDLSEALGGGTVGGIVVGSLLGAVLLFTVLTYWQWPSVRDWLNGGPKLDADAKGDGGKQSSAKNANAENVKSEDANLNGDVEAQVVLDNPQTVVASPGVPPNLWAGEPGPGLGLGPGANLNPYGPYGFGQPGMSAFGGMPAYGGPFGAYGGM